MARYVTTIETPMSSEEAFAYMADVNHFADWDPGVVAVRQAKGSGPGPTAVFDVDVKIPGRTMTLRYVVTEYDPPRRVLLVAETSLLRSIDEVRVEVAGGGSRVTYDAELSMRGAARVFNPVLGLTFKRIGDRAAAGLRAALGGAEVPGSKRS